MRRVGQLIPIGVLVAGLSCPLQAAERNWKSSGSKGVVVSGTSAGTAVGIEILSKGGNAADAAAASILALSVSAVGAFCVGGEAPVLRNGLSVSRLYPCCHGVDEAGLC
jgi:gamma-glutamyltranspeptidase